MSGSRRVRAFIAVGLLGFILQVAVLDGLVSHAGLPYPLAVALAVELAILHNFAWHERWTWRDRHEPGFVAVAGRLVRFNTATALTSIAGNLLVTMALVEWLRVPVIPAGIAAVGLMSVLNFTLTDRVVFRTSGLLAVVLSTAAAPAHAAELLPETVAAFDSYVRQDGAAALARRLRSRAVPVDGFRAAGDGCGAPRAAATPRDRRARRPDGRRGRGQDGGAGRPDPIISRVVRESVVRTLTALRDRFETRAGS
ncbi:MAG TPA: GtrA family protein [Vicinamibacterales bacterium]